MEGHGYQNLDSNLYVCRECFTRIVLLRNCTHVHKETRTVHTANPENLVIPTPENYRRLNRRIVADVKCAGCSRHLGWRCIQANYHSSLHQEGRFGLYLRRLFFWDGYRMLHAYNLRPVIRKRCRL